MGPEDTVKLARVGSDGTLGSSIDIDSYTALKFALASDGTNAFVLVVDNTKGFYGVRVNHAGAILDAPPIQITTNIVTTDWRPIGAGFDGTTYVVTWNANADSTFNAIRVGKDGSILDNPPIHVAPTGAGDLALLSSGLPGTLLNFNSGCCGGNSGIRLVHGASLETTAFPLPSQTGVNQPLAAFYDGVSSWVVCMLSELGDFACATAATSGAPAVTALIDLGQNGAWEPTRGIAAVAGSAGAGLIAYGRWDSSSDKQATRLFARTYTATIGPGADAGMDAGGDAASTPDAATDTATGAVADATGDAAAESLASDAASDTSIDAADAPSRIADATGDAAAESLTSDAASDTSIDAADAPSRIADATGAMDARSGDAAGDDSGASEGVASSGACGCRTAGHGGDRGRNVPAIIAMLSALGMRRRRKCDSQWERRGFVRPWIPTAVVGPSSSSPSRILMPSLKP